MQAQKYEKWLTFVTAKTRFESRDIQPEQLEAIRFFFERKKNMLVNLPTDFGKSLIFQCLPIVADYLVDRLLLLWL